MNCVGAIICYFSIKISQDRPGRWSLIYIQYSVFASWTEEQNIRTCSRWYCSRTPIQHKLESLQCGGVTRSLVDKVTTHQFWLKLDKLTLHCMINY